MMHSFSPNAWKTLRRLHQAGCPLDLDYLRRRYAPVQVFSRPGELQFFCADTEQFYFQVHVQLVAHKPVTIVGWDMQADWLPGKIEWANKCPEHPGFYCLHPQFRQHGEKMLQSPLLYRKRSLKTGMCIEGLLVGRCRGARPVRPRGVPLAATFLLYDGSGYQFEYPLEV
jgi:hypothetical protein